jgi:hypothetical protein
MSGTALDHRLVRDYLRQLDAAMRGWPGQRACDLREQITAHLDEALPPDASDADVAAALRQLGSVAELVDESGRAGTGKVRRPLTRLRRRTWIIIVAAVVLTGAAAVYLIVTLTAPVLEDSGVATWWFPQDVRHRIDSSYGDLTQTTVPVRAGQQGYVISVFNPGNVTETVVGDGSVGTLGWDNLGGRRGAQAAVSTRYWDPPDSLGYGLIHKVKYVANGSIPPHQYRLVRVLWTIGPDVCLSKGDDARIEKVYLRVRVGLFTRTQTIPLTEYYFNLKATSSTCRG